MTILAFLTFVLLLMHHSVSLSRPQCHSCEQTSCNCSRQNLRKVPTAPSELITDLDLSFNRLKTVMKNDFVAYASLQSLIMNDNKIKTIQEQAFDPLINLVKLDLSFNSLDTLSPEWFHSLLSLQHLNLLGNQYNMLGQGNLFHPLKRLKTLYFGGDNLQYVRKSDFSGLGALEEVIFDGQKLQAYAKGSLRQIGPIKYVTLGLNGPFHRNKALVEAILSDVVHPNTTLTFIDTSFITETQMSPFRVVDSSGTASVIFRNVIISVNAGLALLNTLSGSNVTMLGLENTKILINFLYRPNSPTMKHLEELFIKNADIPRFYSFPALFFLQPLLNVVRRVSMLNSTLFAIPCQSAASFSNLEYMDISDNLFSDLALSEMMCDGEGGLWNLQTLNVSRNHLQSINSQLFTKLDKLENIDMSGNAFHSMHETCYWPPSLRFLNLSSTHLGKVTTCLPVSLRILDVSDNALTVFNIDLPFLTELYISGNKLSILPDGHLYPRLTFLFIQNNNLQTFSRNSLNDYDHLQSLEAGTNTYVCSCDFVAFMTSDLTHQRVTIGDELKSYICDSPDTMRGRRVADARLSVFECHTALAFSLLLLGILAVFLLFAVLCHKFSVLWYMKMTWAWLRAKRKPKLKKGELKYDAFVSFSEMDSAWVETHLVPELEQAEPPLRLCIHKRDFIPGGWILDNIMDAIEKSHRTLFVLSQHFVSSDWCKYELDYTHFRLFDHNDDTVVLILLEPIDKDTIPKKFCKLRRVMNSRTYLEWPDDDEQIPRFWQSLRAAIKTPATDDGDVETDTVDL
ncbi:toll-like receptor 2 isoform X1 [Dicentrarchus labrax]|uniref:Toll-like receptor 2 n=2 Tax=Dicentrarchus labrax TaxID=13489 RepID=A0A8P4GSH8_DICLA|nr:toll-like receptor 2 isoform X1 [Dicentrarchus labrax]